ncbi:MAG TPA: MAPEG family protein [Hyphomonadaceae bacterium]|jgi:glutathione S-transferase|nr:MAPEG family protein [Hyphomonadaceae bacterium]HPN05739.1 MAPEG family protein [Hyphomonadaceae bacterium]
MTEFSLQNPVFATYVVAACLMILKAVAMSWLTVVRMVGANGGFRNPEDMKKTPMNPNPHANQTAPIEAVERIRRIHLNVLENVPFFLIAGLLFVTTDPDLVIAQWLFYGYVVSRALHFLAYITAQIHEVRATFWTIGSVILIYMTVATLVKALGY